MRMPLQREFYIPKDSTELKDEQSSAVVYLYTDKRGLSCARGFSGKRAKSDFHHAYQIDAARQRQIETFFSEIRARDAYKAARRVTAPHGLEVGTVLYTIGGYDQTNIGYFQIVGATDKTIHVREIDRDYVAVGDMSGYSTPRKDVFTGEQITVRAMKRGGDLTIKIGHDHAYVDDGRRHYESSDC